MYKFEYDTTLTVECNDAKVTHSEPALDMPVPYTKFYVMCSNAWLFTLSPCILSLAYTYWQL